MVQDRAERKAIDAHVHVWPLDDAPGHRPAADAKLSPPDAAAPVEWLLQDMAEYHVAHCVLVQSSAFGWDNTYMVECLERYPGRFRAIGLVDPESPANARDLERWMAQGLAGFRFHPLYYDREPRGAWWVDAPEHDDLWAAAAATGAILQFHMLPQHAPALARMIERHPQVRVIVDHIGKPDVTEAPPTLVSTRYCASPTTRTSTPRSGTIRLPVNKPSRGRTRGHSCACWPTVSERRGCSGAPAIPAPPGSSRWRRPCATSSRSYP